MSEMQQAGNGSVALTRETLTPSVQRIGGRDIEIMKKNKNHNKYNFGKSKYLNH
jgi:hypothetical protein